MARPPVPNTIELHVRGANDGQFTENLFYYEAGSAPTQELLDDLTAAAAEWVISDWLPRLPTSWFGREIYAKDLSSGSGLQSTDTTIAGQQGETEGDPLPNHVTLAVARRSALAGRSFAGRVYWQGLSQDDLSSQNVISSARALAIIAAIVGLDDVAIALDLVPVIVSYFHDHATRAEGVTTPITNWLYTDLTIDSRRRRLPDRGV